MAATKKSKRERGQEVWEANDYLKGLLAQIPDDKRESVLEHLGEHALRQDEFSRLSDEAAQKAKAAEEEKQKAEALRLANEEWRNKSNAWLAEKQKEIADKEAALTTTQGVDLSKVLTKEEATRLLAQTRQEADAQSLAFIEAVDTIRARHFKEFGEYLTTGELVAHARKVGKPVDAAYDDMTRDRYADKAKKAAEQREKEIYAQAEKDIRSKLGQGMPYPVGNQSDEVGNQTLAGVSASKPGEAPAANPNYGVKAAVQAMLRGDLKAQG